jgi:hypothetical protein
MSIYTPMSIFDVEYSYSQKRPFSRLEGLMLRAFGEGLGLGEIADAFKMNNRMIQEAAFDLMSEGFIAYSPKDRAGLRLTQKGEEWRFKDLRDYERNIPSIESQKIAFSWGSWDCQESDKRDPLLVSEDFVANEGDAEILYGGEILTYEEWADERNHIEKTANYPAILKEPLGELLIKQDGKVLSFVEGEPRIKGERFQYLPVDEGSEKASRHKKPAQKHTPRKRRPAPIKYDEKEWLFSEKDHDDFLDMALQRAARHVFIHSAHFSEESCELINRRIAGLENKPDIYALLGFPDGSDSTESFVNCFSGENVTATGCSKSDLKLIAYDDADNVWHVVVGSYNWLQRYGAARGNAGGELSFVLNSRRHAEAIREIFMEIDSWLAEFPVFAALRSIFAEFVRLDDSDETAEPPRSDDDCEVSRAVFVPGVFLQGECELAIINAKHRCLVSSYSYLKRLSRDGQLGVIENVITKRILIGDPPIDNAFIVAFSVIRDGEEDNDTNKSRQRQLEDLRERIEKLGSPGGVRGLLIQRDIHSRFVVRDSLITISSLNMLSSRNFYRAFGIRVDCDEAAGKIESMLSSRLKRV